MAMPVVTNMAAPIPCTTRVKMRRAAESTKAAATAPKV